MTHKAASGNHALHTASPGRPPTDAHELPVAPDVANRFLELSEDLCVVVDLDGVVRYANGAWTAVLGRNPSDVVGRHLSVVLDRNDWDRTGAAARDAVRDGALRGFENRFLHSDGTARWVQWNIRVDHGTGLAYGIGRDTTARHEAEAALAASEENLRTLFEASLDGVSLASDDGEVIFANPAMYVMLGRDPRDGTRWHLADITDPDDPNLAAFLEERARAGRARAQLALKREDGSTFPAEISAGSLTDANGRKRTSSMFIRDASEHQRLLTAVTEAANRNALQAAALEAAANAIVITDPNGTIQWVNPAFTTTTGYEAHEAIGHNPSLLKSGAHDETFYRELWSTITAGEPWRGEIVNRRKDGTLYTEEQTITPVRGSDGTIANFIAIKQDISLRRAAERALQRSEGSFRHLFENNPLPMYVYDTTTLAFLAVNDAMTRRYGYSEREFLGMHITDIRPAEDIGRLREHLAHLDHEVGDEGTWRHTLADGTTIEVNITTHALTFQDRHARLVVAQDITESLQAKRALRASEERYRMLAENAVDTVFRLRVHPGLAFEYVSPSAEALTGYTPDEHYADPGLFYSVLHPDDRLALQEASAQGGPILSRVRFIHRDGTIVYTEQHSRPIHDDHGTLIAVEGIVRDITERVHAQERAEQFHRRLETQLARSQAVHRLDTTVLLNTPITSVIDTALDVLTQELDVDAVGVFRLDSARRHLRPLAGRRLPDDLPSIPAGRGIGGEAARTRRAVTVLDAHVDTDHDTTYLNDIGMRGCLAVPLTSLGGLEGALELFTRGPLVLDHDAQVFTETIAHQVSLAMQRDALLIDLHTANLDLEDAYDRTIEGWATALDLRDEDTAGHSQRVTDLTLRLAQRLGLPDEDLQHLRRGALLHDIGKMALPDAILLKPGKLTDDEFAVIMRHPTHAYNLLKDIPYLQPALPIPHHHHERWDGTGYPDGLSGEDIPLPARIFAVVDVYDALTSDRPYRPAWTHDAAIEHIRTQAGTHFDPRIVDAFLQLVHLPAARHEGAER